MRFALNDKFIEALVQDENYNIRPDGTVWTVVCRTGKVSLSKQWRELSKKKAGSGHLSIKYRRKHLCIHRVIFRKFHGPLKIECAVNHIDGNPANNTPANLELVTHSENMLHCFRVLGRKPMKPRSKINQEIANLIRAEYSIGLTNKDLRERYGLAKATISYIVNGRTWI